MELCDEHQLRALLARYGFHFSKSMGQNFLIAPEIPREIAAASGADRSCGVLEIGPGIGTLTVHLAQQAGRVVSVELDKSLLPILKETLSPYPNTEVVPGDIMKLELEALVRERFDGLTPLVCANLPYNITTPVLTRLLESGLFRSVTVLVQREVARRICARPGTGDYGAFTLLCQYYAACSVVLEVPPECFLPAPKVTSAVVRMEVLPEPAVRVQDRELLFRTIRASFAQRRKKLLNGLASAFQGELSREELADALTGCGFSDSVRGETLSLEEFARLSNRLGELLNGSQNV
ncbi:MAG: 16S rRNA (adenine(1518)-N(6)/adenine(1519)-N(6))-dimethyltransferase RsmA [Clostridiales bacterium]|nr:16S rRNA (adenine(1518)-N(6)/adenine(1519)-N(6))-dimethyltransferase RsmA [Clostridiales bacterium]